MLENYAQANRKFHNGEIVAVCDRDSHQEIERGVVADVMTLVKLDALWLKDYSDNDKFNKDIEYLRYEIFALKKDGTKSTKHFYQIPHFISDVNGRGNSVYIKKIESNG
jgi:hypothetical protein